MKYGRCLFRSSEALNACMRLWSFTETSKAQMSFWIKMGRLSLGTWTFRKLPRKDCCILRQERHTMQAQRFGKISLTTRKVISGPWGACFTNPWLWSLPLEQRICKASTRKSFEEFIQRSQQHTRMNLHS
jgi:hypothetical protein